MLKAISIITTSTFIISCSSVPATYHIEVSTGTDEYIEQYPQSMSSMLSQATGETVTTVSGDDKKAVTTGTTLRVGITEMTKYIFTRLSWYSVSYAPVEYTFDMSSSGTYYQKLNMTGSGFDAFLGWNGPYIKPGLTYRVGSTLILSEQSGIGSGLGGVYGAMTGFGYALILDIPLGESFSFYGEYQSTTYSNDKPIMEGVEGETKQSWTTVSFGVRAGGW